MKKILTLIIGLAASGIALPSIAQAGSLRIEYSTTSVSGHYSCGCAIQAAAEAATGMFIKGDINSTTPMCEAATSSAGPTMIHGEANNGRLTLEAIALQAADKNYF